jgi:hypothetical protein
MAEHAIVYLSFSNVELIEYSLITLCDYIFVPNYSFICVEKFLTVSPALTAGFSIVKMNEIRK